MAIRNPDGLGLWTLWREDFTRHGRDWFNAGFRALAVHRFGVWRMSVAPKLLRAPLSVLYRVLERRIRRRYGIELPYSVRVGRRVCIEHQSGIVVNGYCEIGDDCILRQNTTIGIKSLDDLTGVPIIGDGVDIGAGAVILGRVTIGDGAVIGANAVVLTDVPPHGLAVGVPARIVERAARVDRLREASA